MAIDYRDMGLGGPSERKTVDETGRRWWTMEGAEVASSITSVLGLLRSRQTQRQTQYVTSARLYGNQSILGMYGASLTRYAAARPGVNDRITFNVVQAVIDTVTAKMAKSRPRPLFLTSGGDYRQQRRAKALTQFVDGIFYENRTYDLGIEAFRDAGVWGDGFLHVFRRGDRVAHERVLPGELYVDELEALYGEPRQMHRVKNVDRAVLRDAFPEGGALITDAPPARLDDAGGATVSDMVAVRESWHLPSGPDAEDGRHVISTDNGVLLSEPWVYPFFPFARLRWTPRLYGYWSQGLAEQLQGNQLYLNKLCWTVQRSLHLAGTFRIFLKNGSKISKEHLNNEVGAIISGEEAPQYLLAPAVQPEVYREIETTIRRSFEQAGVSMLSAASQKPAGLDSRVALREFSDIESDRFSVIGRGYERLFLDVARISIAIAKGIAKEKRGYAVRTPGRRALSSLDWKDVQLDEDEYVMQCFPVSSLPRDPAGRLQTIQEYAQAGYLSPRQARRLLDFPDLEQVEGLANASEDYLQEVLDRIVDEGAYVPPEPFDDLQLAREMALEYYARGRSTGLEEERLELLRRFLAQIDALTLPAQPPPDENAPPANPMPAPQSELVPNVNLPLAT